MAFSLVKDFAVSSGDEGTQLAGRIEAGYADLEAALATHGSLSAGFVNYRELSESDKRQLTDLINALAEPLSKLTSAILQ